MQSSDCQHLTFAVGVDYDYERCGNGLSTEPPELGLSLFPGATALDIMEGAANMSRYYRFIVTFLGDQGYSIDAVNGTMSNELCQWHLFVDTLNGSRSLTQLHHVLPNDTSSAVLHFTTQQVRLRATSLFVTMLKVHCNENFQLNVHAINIVPSMCLFASLCQHAL